jgi:hypothetical protein
MMNNKNSQLAAETLIHYGGSIKMLDPSDENPEKRVGGYLVLFGDAKNTDLAGDFFTKDTDFGTSIKSTTYFDHGCDPVLQLLELGDVELKKDDAGVWAEGILRVRDEYADRFNPYLDEIYTLVAMKKLGWSSGTAGHLVIREPVARGVDFVKRWILGFDASLTPTPCEPRTAALALKSYQFTPLLKHPAQPGKNYGQIKADFERLRFEQFSKRAK